MIIFGLIDIIYAYAYNHRTTQGENTGMLIRYLFYKKKKKKWNLLGQFVHFLLLYLILMYLIFYDSVFKFYERYFIQ